MTSQNNPLTPQLATEGDDLLSSLFQTAFQDNLQAPPVEKEEQTEHLPKAMLQTLDNTLELEHLSSSLPVGHNKDRVLSRLQQLRIDNIFQSYFQFKKTENHVKFFVEQLLKAGVDFDLPNSYSLLHNDIPFSLPTQLFDLHQEICNIKVSEKQTTLMIDNSVSRRLFFARCVRINHALRFYLEKMVRACSFDDLKSVCFVDIEHLQYDDKCLLFSTNDSNSEAYETILIPFVNLQTNLANPPNLFLPVRRLYKNARVFGYPDSFSSFLLLVQISLKRIFNLAVLEKSMDPMHKCNPYLLLEHVLLKTKAFYSSPIRQLFERRVMPAAVLLCLQQCGNLFLLTDGFHFTFAKCAQFSLLLNQKVIICLPEVFGFSDAQDCSYTDQISQQNYISVTPQNVRDGGAYKLGLWRFPAFRSRLNSIGEEERGVYCCFDVIAVYDDICFAEADGCLFVLQPQRQQCVFETCKCHGFLVSVSPSEFWAADGQRLRELRCREVMGGTVIKDARQRWGDVSHNLIAVSELRVLEVNAEAHEAVTQGTDGCRYFLRGFRGEQPGFYSVRGLKMAERGGEGGGRAMLVLDARRVNGGAAKGAGDA